MPAESGHAELTASLFAVALILVMAKLGGDLATRAKQPAVLGELVVGLILGNIGLAGWHGVDFIRTDNSVNLLAQIGVIVLLFEIGLQSTLGEMAQVGRSAVFVGVLGVIAPFALGWGVGAWLLPDRSAYVHAFLGAALTATSVGITARVLQDLGKSQTPEARVILGAAVIDDVLGLMILAAISGVIASLDGGGPSGWAVVAIVVLKAAAFLGGALLLGRALTPAFFRTAARLRGSGVLLCVSLGFCFALAWLAGVVGLAPIVGAFAAGLILENVHYEPFRERGERQLEELIQPVTQFLAPIFFVTMGAHVDATAFADTSVLFLASALVIAAIVGKQACMLGVVDKGVRRLPVGIGMIPRGEVGLIFISLGLTLRIDGQPIVDASTYGAVVIVVVVTTLITPPALAWSLRR